MGLFAGCKNSKTDLSQLNMELLSPEVIQLQPGEEYGVGLAYFLSDLDGVQSYVDSLYFPDEEKLKSATLQDGVYTYTLQDYSYRIDAETLQIEYRGNTLFTHSITDDGKQIRYKYDLYDILYTQTDNSVTIYYFDGYSDIERTTAVYFNDDGYTVAYEYETQLFDVSEEIYSADSTFTGLKCSIPYNDEEEQANGATGRAYFNAYSVSRDYTYSYDGKLTLTDTDGNVYRACLYPDNDNSYVPIYYVTTYMANKLEKRFILVQEGYEFPDVLVKIQ